MRFLPVEADEMAALTTGGFRTHALSRAQFLNLPNTQRSNPMGEQRVAAAARPYVPRRTGRPLELPFHPAAERFRRSMGYL